MRKHTIVLQIATALLLTAGSCQREAFPELEAVEEQTSVDGEEEIPEGFVRVTLTAYDEVDSEVSEDSKVALEGLKVVWAPGDEIGITAMSAGAPVYKFTTKDGGKMALFTGVVPKDFTNGKAFFPYSAIYSNSSSNNFRVRGVPPSIQYGIKGGVDNKAVPLTTCFDKIGDDLVFHHLSAFLKVSVSSPDVKQVKFRTDGLYPTGGSFSSQDVKCHGALSISDFAQVNVGTGSLVFNCGYRGEDYVLLRPSSGDTFEPGDYYVVIPATDSKDVRELNNLTITYVKSDDSRWSSTSNHSNQILPGRIYSFGISEADCVKEPSEVQMASVGKIIPDWKKGCFDIHFINTMSGEGYFMIFPDGTQMMIDAAGSLLGTGPVNSTTNVGIRERWDPTKDETYNFTSMFVEYIHQCMVWTENNKMDYVLSSHFHGDHYGKVSGASASYNTTDYVLQNLVAILDYFAVGKVMDRGWPTYDYPFDMKKYYGDLRNWVKAVEWHKEHSGVTVERFRAGDNKQIVLNRAASEYPTFSVRNIGVNGDVWTGVGTAYTSTFPALSEITCADPPDVNSSTDNCPAENHNSCVLKFTYGKFDFWAGGDQQYNGMSSYKWKNSETTMAKACGQVDVMKADHHGTANTNGSGHSGKDGDKALAMQYLNPKCWIVNNWVDGQPRQATYEGVVKMCPDVDIFITNTCTSQTKYGGYSTHNKGANGHIVVRVLPGGSQYYVYVLEDKERSMKVKTVSGPYSSR